MQRVVAAVIQREGRYLLCQRPPGKRHAGLWEFPGGKVQDREADTQALERELMEELRVAVSGEAELIAEQIDELSGFLICFMRAQIQGEPACMEHAEIGWFLPEETQALDLAPADHVFSQKHFLP
jgi:8-oxo-dGTP diphosphatase